MAGYLVRLPLGLVWVRLERMGLPLEERGGFETRWAESERGEALEPEAFRLAAKAELRRACLEREGREPPTIPLNLASHQLLEDLVGWSRLNYRR